MILLIALVVIVVLSSTTTVFMGIKLSGDGDGDTTSAPTVSGDAAEVTLADIKKTEKDYENADFSSHIKDGVLKIADCGAVANSPYDYGPLIRSALVTVINNPGTTLEFSEGTYYVAPLSPSETYVFDLGEYEVSELHIDGKGCTFMLLDNYLGCFNLRKSNNVVIENMKFDCIEEPFIQGTVKAYDPGLQILTVEADEAYTVFDDERLKDRFSTVFGTVREKDNPLLLKKNCNNFFFFTSYNKISDKEFQFVLSSQTMFTNKYIEVGDKVTLGNRKGETTFIFDMCYSGKSTFKDITIYNCPGGGIVGAQLTGDMHISGFRMLPDPRSNNWICGNADGVHIQGSRGKVTMENCVFSNLVDDAVNLYQWGCSVDKVVSPTVVRVNTQMSPLKIGDTIEIIDPVSVEIMGTAKIKDLRAVEGKRITQAAEVVLESAIGGLDTAAAAGKYYFYVKDKTFTETVIKNCTFQNSRGRGLVLCTTNTTVENCKFTGISNHALNGWFDGSEGFELQGLTFKNNTIENCHYLLQEVDKGTSGAIHITMNNDAGVQSKNITHNNINIIGNTIIDYHGCAISIGNSQNVTIKDNFFDLKQQKYPHTKNNALYLNYSKNVLVENNVFNDDSENLTAAIRYNGATMNGLSIKGNTFACDANLETIIE